MATKKPCEKWRTTERLRVGLWKPSEDIVGGMEGFAETWIPAGTILTGPTSVSDKMAMFTTEDGRTIDIHRDQDYALKPADGPERYRVWCRVSGGVTGTREAWLKSDGKVKIFRTAEEAKAEAKRLSADKSPYATADFHYHAVPESDWANYWEAR